MSISTKAFHTIFSPALVVSDILIFKMFKLQKVGQRQVCKVISHISLALTVSEILKFQIFELETNRSRSLSVIFAMVSLVGKYPNL